MQARIREASDDDGDAVGELIAACWSEYDGCIFNRAAELPELDAIASYFRGRGGRFWVAEADQRLIACAGVVPGEADHCELLKMYVAEPARGAGLAAQLLKLIFTTARGWNCKTIDLWSDTRFERAHGFYAKHGFERTGERRFLADLSNTWEYQFRRPLDSS